MKAGFECTVPKSSLTSEIAERNILVFLEPDVVNAAQNAVLQDSPLPDDDYSARPIFVLANIEPDIAMAVDILAPQSKVRLNATLKILMSSSRTGRLACDQDL